MVNFCAIVGCGHRGDRDKKSFYRLPAIITNQGEKTEKISTRRRSLWLSRIARKDLKDSNLPYTRVCSDHFISGKPASLYDDINPDWAPSLSLGHEKIQGRMRTATPRYEKKLQQAQKVCERAAASALLEEDQIADADMDDPLNITAPTVKEEISFKEEALDESEVFIDPGAFSVPTGKVGVKRERDSSEETETATEGETPTYGSEDDWVLHPIGRKSHPQRLRDPLEDVRVSCNELPSQNIGQKISTAHKKDENPTKRLRSLEESSETEGGLREDESDPLGSGVQESEEEILLEKEIEMKKKEIEMRKKALEVMHRKVDHGDITAEKQDSDSSVIELLKSDLHVAVEELGLLLQQRTFLLNGKKISHLELKLNNEEMNMREEEHQMKLKIYDIKKAYLFESSQMNGGLV